MSSQIKWNQVGDVLEVSGLLTKVGRFTPADGESVEFNKDSLKILMKNSRSNIPLWFLHQETGRMVPAGWISQLGFNSDETEIHYQGKVFNTDVIPLIKSNRFNKTSMEADLDLGPNNLVIGGRITGNAFVDNPAVDGTRVKAKKVAMEYGGITLDEIEEFLKSKGLSDEDIGMARKLFAKKPEPVDKKDKEEKEEESTLNANEGQEDQKDSVPEDKTVGEADNKSTESTPNADGNDGETSKKGEEPDEGGNNGDDDQESGGQEMVDKKFEAELDALRAENAKFKAQLEESHKKEFSSLIETLKSKGYKEPEKLVEGMEMSDAIGMLKKFSAAAPSVEGGFQPGGPSTPTDPKKESKEAQFSRVLDEMGLTDTYNKLFPEGK